MATKYSPRKADGPALIRLLESRIDRLGKLLDEVWDVASDALGAQYFGDDGEPTKTQPTPHEAALQEIAELSASALGSIDVYECDQ